MGEWTRARSRSGWRCAADVMRALPGVKPQGYFSTWPKYLHTFADKVGQQPEMRRPRPSPRAITEAEEAMLWLRWLEPDDCAPGLEPESQGTAWKPICWQFGISRATAHRRREFALSVIAWRLNGKQPHLRRGRKYVINRFREEPAARRTVTVMSSNFLGVRHRMVRPRKSRQKNFHGL